MHNITYKVLCFLPRATYHVIGHFLRNVVNKSFYLSPLFLESSIWASLSYWTVDRWRWSFVWIKLSVLKIVISELWTRPEVFFASNAEESNSIWKLVMRQTSLKDQVQLSGRVPDHDQEVVGSGYWAFIPSIFSNLSSNAGVSSSKCLVVMHLFLWFKSDWNRFQLALTSNY